MLLLFLFVITCGFSSIQVRQVKYEYNGHAIVVHMTNSKVNNYAFMYNNPTFGFTQDKIGVKWISTISNEITDKMNITMVLSKKNFLRCYPNFCSRDPNTHHYKSRGMRPLELNLRDNIYTLNSCFFHRLIFHNNCIRSIRSTTEGLKIWWNITATAWKERDIIE